MSQQKTGTTTFTISLPRRMAAQLEVMRKAEDRTRSELVREALRRYFARPLPVEMPTAQERRAIARGRREFARGEFVTLAELEDELASRHRKVRAKSA